LDKLLKDNASKLIEKSVEKMVSAEQAKDPRYVNGKIDLLPKYHYENMRNAFDTLSEEYNMISKRLDKDTNSQFKMALNLIDMGLDYVKNISSKTDDFIGPKLPNVLEFPKND